MAKATFTKDSSEFRWFGDFWKLVQKYWNPEDKPEYWEEAYKDFDKLYTSYGKDTKLSRFSHIMTIALMNFLEGECKIAEKR